MKSKGLWCLLPGFAFPAVQEQLSVIMDKLVRTVLAIENSDRLLKIQDEVRSIGRSFGYDRYLLFSSSSVPDETIDRIYWVEGKWFANGTKVDAKTYARRCPVVHHVLDVTEAFFWSKTKTARGETYRIVRSPRGPGLHGFQIPVFGHTGLEGAMSFGGEHVDGSPLVRLTLIIVGTAAFRAARRLLESNTGDRPLSLSPREREVLRWTAAGRRQADIAAILGLSERTIENHLRRVRRRLGVTTTAQAVRAAIRRGEIEG